MHIKAVKPTVFFIRKENKLLQAVDITIRNSGGRRKVDLITKIGSQKEDAGLGLIEAGEETYRIHIPDIDERVKVEFLLLTDGKLRDRQSIIWKPQRHWNVYIVHHSHHDLGYTDLPSNVLNAYDSFYDDILRFCDETNNFPEEAKFRYQVEAAWSILHFIENRPEHLVNKLIKYVKEGRIEVTALFGHLVTELCGSEELIRALYPSFELKRKYNIPIHTAELNDIPGVSWGLIKVLANSGIKYFSPEIPLWYFARYNIHPFWDEEKVINLKIPGGFIWKSQDGKEALCWYSGGNFHLGDYEQGLRDLSDSLDLLETHNYPFSLVSYPVRGGDNAPPSLKLSHIIKKWNEEWAFPRLTIATKYLFLKEFERVSKGKLPVFSGELPDTDYNIGAISAAKETGINRITHDRLLSAEKFATIASKVSDYSYPKKCIDKTYKNILYYDLHCLSFFHPMGPSQDGNWSEKSNFAYRAQAFSYDVLSKSLNRVVDEIELPDGGYHIVVFNPLSHKRTDIVRVPFLGHLPLFEAKYSGRSTAIERDIVNLPIDILEEGFEVVDTETGEKIPYQIVELKTPEAPTPYAAERYARGQLHKLVKQSYQCYSRSELFEIVFLSQDVPSIGYKTYRIIPSVGKANFKGSISVSDTALENSFYKLTLDSKTGSIISIYDKELEREIVDKNAPHKFNQFIARWSKTGKEDVQKKAVIRKGEHGPVYASLIVSTKGVGCPQITQEIVLYDKVKRIDISNRLLRDSTPLLEHYFAFPFLVKNPKFEFEGTDSVIEPLKDQLPGSNTDYYTLQNWASVYNEESGIIFSSIEAPVIEFGGLWPGYVSGTHICVVPKGFGHKFVNEFSKGYIYSYIMNNNFRTNFKNTQVSDCLFRYSFTSQPDGPKTIESYKFGGQVHNPLVPVCIEGEKKGSLPKSTSFCQLDQPNVLLLALKEAEDSKGLIIRLIETEGKSTLVRIALPFVEIKKAYLTNLVEENEEVIPIKGNRVDVSIAPFGIATVRVNSYQVRRK